MASQLILKDVIAMIALKEAFHIELQFPSLY